MLDVKWIRNNQEAFNRLMHKRGAKINIDALLNLDEKKRETITLIQQFQEAKNKKSKKLAQFRGKDTPESEQIKQDVKHINEKLTDLTQRISSYGELQDILDHIPNLPRQDVPYGANESLNKVVKKFKEPNKILNAKEHFEIGKNLGMMDFEQTAKISGSRFVTLSGSLAKLARALTSFMIDIHTEMFNFQELSVPSLVHPKAMYNSGQLPKFKDESYVTNNDEFRLISTGEIPLVNMVADSIIQHEDLPKRYVTYTECFRSEAGSAGKDTAGMLRTHQFGKVELVTITTPEKAEVEHDYMLSAAEEILKRLDMPYRVVLLCAGDMGFTASKTYDIEVWLPGQDKYREISSVSNCADFQARRMKARYKHPALVDTQFVHTLNGSGLAVGRTIVALLENYQNPDGSVTVPLALRPYMGIDNIA